MLQAVCKVLAAINKIILPRYSRKDLTKLSTFDKAIVGYRIWATINSLPK